MAATTTTTTAQAAPSPEEANQSLSEMITAFITVLEGLPMDRCYPGYTDDRDAPDATFWTRLTRMSAHSSGKLQKILKETRSQIANRLNNHGLKQERREDLDAYLDKVGRFKTDMERRHPGWRFDHVTNVRAVRGLHSAFVRQFVNERSALLRANVRFERLRTCLRNLSHLASVQEHVGFLTCALQRNYIWLRLETAAAGGGRGARDLIAHLDTGATVSTLSSRMIKHLGATVRSDDDAGLGVRVTVQTWSGLVDLRGPFELRVTVQGCDLGVHEFYESCGGDLGAVTNPVLLGMNVFAALRRLELHFGGAEEPLAVFCRGGPPEVSVKLSDGRGGGELMLNHVLVDTGASANMIDHVDAGRLLLLIGSGKVTRLHFPVRLEEADGQYTVCKHKVSCGVLRTGRRAPVRDVDFVIRSQEVSERLLEMTSEEDREEIGKRRRAVEAAYGAFVRESDAVEPAELRRYADVAHADEKWTTTCVGMSLLQRYEMISFNIGGSIDAPLTIRMEDLPCFRDMLLPEGATGSAVADSAVADSTVSSGSATVVATNIAAVAGVSTTPATTTGVSSPVPATVGVSATVSAADDSSALTSGQEGGIGAAAVVTTAERGS